MSVFDNAAFERHERIVHCTDPVSGLRAIIAVHSTHRGPAAGGCRLWHYANANDAVTDVLRLSQGMSYKNAMAGLDLGGGKAVIMADPSQDVTEDQLRAFGRFVETLRGSYITAEDVGMTVEAMQIIASETRHVAGLPPEAGKAGGDPSPKTADGVFHGIRAAVAYRLERDSLEGLRVAVQGVGHVGANLCKALHDAGAKLWVADINESRVEHMCDAYGAQPLPLDEIITADVDVVAPCALGAVLNANTIAGLRTSIVAGAANNQLATDQDGQLLFNAGVLYAPDYVINAGGIINVACEYSASASDAEVDQRVEEIGARLKAIFEQSERLEVPTNVIADEMAKGLIGRGAGTKAH
ncbi:MAG: Glu/Leu/Phe/Val dehydrogenase dimerization domain-containing protein [Pseudomonadota bacterium]